MNSGLASKRSFVLVLGLLTSLIAVSIDISLPGIPQMVDDLATTMRLGQQIIGFFLAGIALGQIPAGLLSDRAGRIHNLRDSICRTEGNIIKAARAKHADYHEWQRTPTAMSI